MIARGASSLHILTEILTRDESFSIVVQEVQGTIWARVAPDTIVIGILISVDTASARIS
jgi:hypothetical protein